MISKSKRASVSRHCSRDSLWRLFWREFKRVSVNGVDTLKMEIIHGCLRPIVGVTQRVYEIYIDTAEIIESLLWTIWTSRARMWESGARVTDRNINNGARSDFVFKPTGSLMCLGTTSKWAFTNSETALEKMRNNKEHFLATALENQRESPDPLVPSLARVTRCQLNELTV